jgi:hypothetical protein
MKRRDFIKIGAGVLGGIALSSRFPGVLISESQAATRNITVRITDAIKEMATYNGLNQDPNGTCYFWVYQMSEGAQVIPPDCPGPTIYATGGDVINMTVTNELDEPHAFFIPGFAGANTGPIPPLQNAPANVANISFTVGAGAYLYYDNLNAPVNRVMGLHGALVVMPKSAQPGHKLCPYAKPTPQIQALFDDLGTAPHWPGLSWEAGDPATMTSPQRQYTWICHQASPKLFRTVGSLAPGVIFDAAEFTRLFQKDDFKNDSFNIDKSSHIPTFFTINGQSGHFCHNNPCVTAMARVGEPLVIRVMNAGLMSHSMHLHANHYYVLSVDGVMQGTPNGTGENNATLLRPGIIWVDTFTLNQFGSPASRYDLLVPMMRPPDIPNVGGIGRAGSGDAAYATTAGGLTYPPLQEFNVFQQKALTALSSIDGTTVVPTEQRQSPLCYPMHDHSEPTQSSQGGNYNTALISGVYFIGDRNVELAPQPGLPPQTFPMDEDFKMMILKPNPTAPDRTICYGIDEARKTGIMQVSRDSKLESQANRPPFPPGFPDPFPPA